MEIVCSHTKTFEIETIVKSTKTQISAISQKVMIKLKKEKVLSKIEGIDNCDWVLIDAGDVILNLFKKEVRNFYDLEKFWGSSF